ncbi:MAG: 2,3-dimethylmalate lyase [Candidatus Accumulibacter appositus]|uniref:2,3-dimethylmalate lyase n=1 Tax=Candidatus Accumulibacter appositus TaxID=1454003 RepID=A0A011PWQ2_9PROT|nr:isocitrate lyase/PEP mutase family protein [Accumulibacter sp.]EXI81290.1 MAG: 2,3-dimethylmalate lyase [Candidatus Accumulibacter appositus]
MSMQHNQGPVSAGERLRESMGKADLVSFIGVYDVFSATVAARHFDSLFVSGFGFAASHYGLPDVGFITWTDIVAFVQRLRTVLPTHHLLVDIDDGYCDPEVACHVVSVLESAGASAVVLEDQRRPRRCGHFEGKQIMEIEEYLAKLKAVLAVRRDMLVIARTDSSDLDDIARRVSAFADAGADAVLVDGLKSLDTVRDLSKRIDRPFCFNQIAGGKSPACTQSELRDAGVALVIYSTPCLFAAQAAIDDAMATLKDKDGTLAGSRIGVSECTRVLNDNLARRDRRSS